MDGSSFYHDSLPPQLGTQTRQCLKPKAVRTQKFTGLKIQAEAWPSNKLISDVALILLRERLGFKDANVVQNTHIHDSWTTPHLIGDGTSHLGFEVPPIMANKAGAECGKVNRADYRSLFSCSRIFCRKGTDGRPAMKTTLEDALSTTAGVARFSPQPPLVASQTPKDVCSTGNRACDADGIFRPSICRSTQCTAQMISMHIPTTAEPRGMELMIEQLKLPLMVVYMDIADLEKHVYETARRGPNDADLLFRAEEPTQRLGGVDVHDHFYPLDFPNQSRFGTYGAYTKWFWPGLGVDNGEDAKAFIEAFQLNTDQWRNLLQRYTHNNDTWTAACSFLLDQPSLWEPWIQFPSRIHPGWEYIEYSPSRACFSRSSCLADFGTDMAGLAASAWVICLLQFIMGMLLAVVYPRMVKSQLWRMGMGAMSKHIPGYTQSLSRLARLTQWSLYAFLSFLDPDYKTEHEKHHRWLQTNHVRRNEQASSLFCGHERTFENFCRHNSHPLYKAPPGSPLEVEGIHTTHLMRWNLLSKNSNIRYSFILSLGLGMLSGSCGTYLWLLASYQDNIDMTWGEQPSGMVYDNLIAPVGDAFGNISSDFRFFPTFAGLGLLGFFIRRWRNFYFAAWRVEGRLKDMSVIIASAVTKPDDPETLQVLFKSYRYLCAAMAMQYKAYIHDLSPDPLDKLIELGLLNISEVEILRPSGSRVRDNLLSWIGIVVCAGRDKGLFSTLAYESFMEQLTQCRANMMFFHGNNFFPVSNTWTALVQFSVDLFATMLVLGAPFKLYVKPTKDLQIWGAWQPWISLGTFPVLFAFWGVLDVCDVLMKPFAHDFDTMNIDALIAGTEETLFANLRSHFNLAFAEGRVSVECKKLGNKKVSKLSNRGSRLAMPRKSTPTYSAGRKLDEVAEEEPFINKGNKEKQVPRPPQISQPEWVGVDPDEVAHVYSNLTTATSPATSPTTRSPRLMVPYPSDSPSQLSSPSDAGEPAVMTQPKRRRKPQGRSKAG